MARKAVYLVAVLWLLSAAAVAIVASVVAEDATESRRIDPADWGSDHVGKPLPQNVTGDECLFCHRDIGPTWPDNRHQLTIRPAAPDDSAIKSLREQANVDGLIAETQYLLGSRRVTRFLKRSRDYGKLELLTASCDLKAGALRNGESPEWDSQTFADRCAGCHTTAVNTKTRSFAALSLDCFACHGDVPLEHTKDVGRVYLSDKNREPRVVVSICGQCHLRGGKSKSSGLPYPNTFVAGDNLFRDFQVDFSDAAIGRQPAIDQHIFQNARDVAVFGRSAMTCLTCHDVHKQSTEKHQLLETAGVCSSCHVPGTDNTKLREAMLRENRLRTRSRVCDY